MSRKQAIEKIQKRINALWVLVRRLTLQVQRATKAKSRSALLYEQARLTLGRDASPLDIVNDDLGCAESVSQLIRKVVPFPIITGTWTLNDKLSKDPRFSSAHENISKGTIIICATGTGNGKIRGHVGILANGWNIMAANSRNGIWSQYYTLTTWKERWVHLGGFAIHYYTLK